MTATQINPKDVNTLLPHARALVAVEGPSQAAGDDSISGMAFAVANRELIKPRWSEAQQTNTVWCECTATSADTAYFANTGTGAHGWMCCNCRGIVQTG